jgi:predicted dehydrogenase
MRMGIIASYHSFHASQALAFLQLPESSVLIEKPPCLTIAELEALASQYDPHRIFLGYNRRFIEWNWRARDILDAHGLPVVMTIMVNEAQIASDHWYFASNQGSRVSGNLCHFLDLAVFLLQKQPVRISLGRNTVLGIERSTFVVLFEDGSIVNLIPSDLGDGTRGVQEHISIKSESLELTIGDYLWMRVWEKGRVRKYAVLHRNKGHQAMYRNYKQSVFQGRPSTIGRRELIHSSLLYISFVRLFASGDDAKELDFSPFGLYMS